MTPYLSICMPVYNGQVYLHSALESALAQDYGDFELVVGDDASTDETVEVANSVEDKRVRVLVFDTNLGLAGNWNRTIRHCRGTYIKYLAQDDLLSPGALSRFAAATTRFPGHRFYFCANEQINESARCLRLRRVSCPDGPLSSSEMLALLFLHGNQVGGPTNTLIEANAFSEVNWFDASCAYALDWVMWVQIARRYGGVYIDEPLVRIREHEGSETRRLSKRDAIWWDGYEALRVLRRREPELARWLNVARLLKLASLPRWVARSVLIEGASPVHALARGLEILRDGLWW